MHHRVIYSSMLGESKMSVESFVPAAMQFTQGAANKVKALVEEEGNPRLNEDDTLIEREGVSLVVDPMSFQYLAGAEVDYTEGLEGSRFIINNPNATTTCGCGSSFTV